MNAKFLRCLDKTAGFLAYAFLPAVGWLLRKGGGKNILVIKLWAIGESILTFPAIRELRRLYPDCRITALCTDYNRELFENCRYVDSVIAFSPGTILKTISEIRKGNFSVAVDFEPYTKFSSVLSFLSGAKTRVGFSNRRRLYTKSAAPEGIHAVNNFINLVRLLGDAPYPEGLDRLTLGRNAEKTAAGLLRKAGLGIRIGIHAGLGYSSAIRKWDEKNFSVLCDELAEKYKAKIILVGSKKESRVNRKIISAMRHDATEIYESLPVLAAVLERLDLFIANDSGPMHLAAAMGVPTIGLFGPNMPGLYGPYGRKNIGLYKGPEEPYIKPFEGKFPERYREEYDINKITVEDVMEAAGKILKHGSIRP